jgi:hypothetical protein
MRGVAWDLGGRRGLLHRRLHRLPAPPQNRHRAKSAGSACTTAPHSSRFEHRKRAICPLSRLGEAARNVLAAPEFETLRDLRRRFARGGLPPVATRSPEDDARLARIVEELVGVDSTERRAAAQLIRANHTRGDVPVLIVDVGSAAVGTLEILWHQRPFVAEA